MSGTLKGEQMTKDLQTLIELARRHKITKEEHEAQVKSFTYGNTHFENESITREDVDRVMESLKPSPSYSSK
jgi:hypothetical protein